MSDVYFYEVFKNKVYEQLKYFSSEEEFDQRYYEYLNDIVHVFTKRSTIEGADLLVMAADRFKLKYAAPGPVDNLRRYNFAKGKSYADYVVSHKGAISKTHVARLINHSFFYRKFLKIELYSYLNFSNLFKLKKTDKDKATFILQSNMDTTDLIHEIDKRVGLKEPARGRQAGKDIAPDNGPSDFLEGALKRMTQNIYERDARARRVCLNHYGFNCQVCGFNFEEKYGDIGRQFIHVHHLTPLSQIGESYRIDPVRELLPVCPNCHAMLHREDPPLTIALLKELIR